MEKKNKTLNELLAVMGGGDIPVPNQTSFQPTIPTAPIASITTTPPTSRNLTIPPPSAASTNPPATVSNNYNELLSLFSAPTNLSAQQPNPSVPFSSQTSIPVTSAPRQLQQRTNFRPKASLDPKATVALKNIHANVMQKHEAIPKSAHVARALSTMPSIPNPQRPISNDITAELQAVMAKTTPTLQTISKSQPQPPSSLPSASSQHHLPHARPPAKDGHPVHDRKPLTAQQMIVEQFCRYSFKRFARIMEGDPLGPPLQARLKEQIKGVWIQWSRGIVTRPHLLESIAAFVKGGSPKASQVDVIQDFRVWYERQNKLHKQLKNPDQTARLQQELFKRKTNQMNALNVGRRAPSSLHISTPGSVMPGTTVLQPPKPEPVTRQSVKQRQQMMQSLGHATGGKKLANKSVPTMLLGANRKLHNSVRGKANGDKSAPNIPNAENTLEPPIAPKTSNCYIMGVNTGRGIAIEKSPSMNRGPSGRGIRQPGEARASKGIAEGKSVSGGKGLMYNNTPVAAKPETARKNFSSDLGKVSSECIGEGSTKAAITQPKSNAMIPPGGPMASLADHAEIEGNNKRTLEGNMTALPGKAVKRPKTNPKGGKNVTHKGKKVAASVGGCTTGIKKRGMKKPSVGDVAGVEPGVHSNDVGTGVGNGNAGAGKKVRRTEDGLNEISVVNNIVDIEDEEEKLGKDIGSACTQVDEVADCGGEMFVGAGRLRTKMQKITKRFGLSENVSKEAMEVMSLAVRERVAGILESLKEIAAVRIEANKQEWNTAPTGINVYEEMMRRRQSEERSLQIAASMRAKREKEQKEKDSKKDREVESNNEKKAKDCGVTSETERKEKLALEKKRKESSSQRDALSGLLRNIDKRRKKPSLSKGLAPLEPLGKKGAILPPIPRRMGATSFRSGGTNSGNKKRLDHSKLKGVVPVGKTRGNMNGIAEKVKLSLQDCLFLMKGDGKTRKSVYKWYARVGDRRTR